MKSYLAVCKPFVVPIALVLLSIISLAQEPEDEREVARFHSAHTVEVTEVRSGDPILGLAGGTVWLEVTVDENAKVENITTRRGIEELTPHVVRWVRTWKWKPAELNGTGMSSVVTVAVTANPRGIPTNSPLPPLKESSGPAQSPLQFLPPQLISATFPVYPNNTILSDSVALDVTIGQRGEPVKVIVLRDVPPLTAAAIHSLNAWKFAPASIGNKPVAAHVTLAFVYRSPASNFPLGR